MTIKILTLFPEMFEALNCSVIGRAIQSGVAKIQVTDIRHFTSDKHGKCDDTPFGGGAGMVMTPQPIFDAIASVDPNHDCRRIYLSPRGKVLTSVRAKSIAKDGQDVLLLCGHYEGIDQRVIDLCIDEEISIGDYVLTGGELPAMVLIDTLLRFVNGVLGSSNSAEDESFCDGLLEYPHYTRPQNFNGLSVPEVLLSGHHANIEKWRTEKSREVTKKMRPDLFAVLPLLTEKKQKKKKQPQSEN